jgi:hypothetical protein
MRRTCMPATKSRKTRPHVAGVTALALASALAVATAAPASAAPPVSSPEEDFEAVYTAGSACAGFDLRVQGTGSNRTVKDFTDENGNTRLIAAGKGWDLTFTNDFNGKTLVVPSTGSHTDFKVFPGPPDDGESLTGLRTLHSSGTFFLVLFPFDVPAGPSATLYKGGQVYLTSRDDEGAIWRLQRASGRTTDICALID